MKSTTSRTLLPFQEDILNQILQEDRGLWIVESGLGLSKIMMGYISKLEKQNDWRLLYLFLNPDPQVPVFERFVQMAPHRYELINSDYSPEQRYAIVFSKLFIISSLPAPCLQFRSF